MISIEKLLENNCDWAKKTQKKQADFFTELSQKHTPNYLWIGCSDSRVPANEIVDLPAGKLFVHRNIANLIIPEDINCQSVIQYAVESLKIKHIIICGHYDCGGIKAGLNGKLSGNLAKWLSPINKMIQKYEKLSSHLSNKEKGIFFSEINVAQQLLNLSNIDCVKEAMKNDLLIHGLVYNLETGHLMKLLTNINSSEKIKDYISKNFDIKSL